MNQAPALTASSLTTQAFDLEQRLRAQLDLSQEAILVVDADGLCVEANAAACELFGLGREALLGRYLGELAATCDGGTTAPPWRTAEPPNGECVLTRPDGSTRDVQFRTSASALPGFRVTVMQDVTARRQAESAARESEALFARMFHLAPINISLSTLRDGRLILANQRCADFFGYRREEMIGRTSTELGVWAEPGDRDRLIEKLRQAGPIKDLEIPLKRRDGEIRYCLFSAEKIDLGAPHEPMLLTMVVDITDRRQREAALRRSEERFSKVFHASPIAIVVANLTEGRLLDANDRYFEISGYTRQQVIGRVVAELGLWVNPADRTWALAQLHEAGHVRDMEADFRAQSGEIRQGLLSMELIELDDKQEPVILSLLADVTDRKRAEHQVRQYTTHLEMLSELSQAMAEVGTDVTSLLNLVARRLAEAIGDCCIMSTLPEDGEGPNAIGFHHTRPEALELLRQALTAAPGPAVAALLRLGADPTIPSLPEVFDPDLLRQRLPPEYGPYLDRYGVGSWMIVPLRVNGQITGSASLFRDRGRPAFTAGDHGLLKELAGRAALAVANARLYESVHAGRKRLQDLSRQLVEAQEAERRYVARELHDEISQILTGLKLTLDLNPRLSGEAAAVNNRRAQDLVHDILMRVKSLSLALRPAMLDDLGLLPAALSHLERFTAQTGVQVDFRHTHLEGRRFQPEVETTLYRIMQEALTNVARHANVQEATVRLWASDEVAGIQVEDRGAGFDWQRLMNGQVTSGLTGMHERVLLLGGSLTIESAAGAGARISAQLPIEGR